MNKTIIININGIIFHIEEDAYELLRNYMTDVKRHFMNSADSLEITTDIENRIAEMFTEILGREGKQVVVEDDVKKVIGQMGSVADFETAEQDSKGHFTTDSSYAAPRRLFRDADDHLIAGVCAGIANYFDVEAVWIRLAFGLLSFAAGSGVFIYIVLWVVVPKAVTRADRMAMKGEKLDLQGFKKNFEEEMHSMKGHISNLQHEAKPFIYKSRDFTVDFFQHLGNFLGGAGKVFAKFIGIAILVACFAALIGLIIAVITFLAFGNAAHMDLYQMFPFNIVNHEINNIFTVCAFLVLAIPLLTIILVVISAVFSNTTFSRTTGSALLCIWIAAIGCVIYYGAKASADFRSYAGFSKNVVISPTAKNTYYLTLNESKSLTGEDSIRYRIKERFNSKIILNDDDFDVENDWPGGIRIRIEKGDVAKPLLIESFSARGRDYADALTNASSTAYRFTQQDSVLTFDRRLQRPLNRLWRGQSLELILKVPMNARVVIDEKISRYLDGGFSVYDCKEINKQDKATSATFVMTDNGLQCKVDTLVTAKPALATDSVKN